MQVDLLQKHHKLVSIIEHIELELFAHVFLRNELFVVIVIVLEECVEEFEEDEVGVLCLQLRDLFDAFPYSLALYLYLACKGQQVVDCFCGIDLKQFDEIVH